MPGPMRQRAPEQSKDFLGAWKKLLRYCKKFAPAIVTALVCSIGGTALTLIGPDKLGELTNVVKDGILTGIDLDAVADIGATLIVYYSLSMVLSVVQGWLMANVTQRLAQRMRGDIAAKIDRLPMSYYNKTSTGDILSRVTNDVDTIGQSMHMAVGNLVSSVTLMVGSRVMMRHSFLLTGAAILATLRGFVLMLRIMSRSQNISCGSSATSAASTAISRKFTPVTRSSRHTTARTPRSRPLPR